MHFPGEMQATFDFRSMFLTGHPSDHVKSAWRTKLFPKSFFFIPTSRSMTWKWPRKTDNPSHELLFLSLCLSFSPFSFSLQISVEVGVFLPGENLPSCICKTKLALQITSKAEWASLYFGTQSIFPSLDHAIVLYFRISDENAWKWLPRLLTSPSSIENRDFCSNNTSLRWNEQRISKKNQFMLQPPCKDSFQIWAETYFCFTTLDF